MTFTLVWIAAMIVLMAGGVTSLPVFITGLAVALVLDFLMGFVDA